MGCRFDMGRRARTIALTIVAAVVAGIPFVMILMDRMRPSWVSVVNRSGFPLEDVVIVTEPDRHHCAVLPVGQAFTVTVSPSDSKSVDVSFRCQGRRRFQPNCGNIGSCGEQRTVVVLSGGDSVEVDYGGAPCEILETLANE